MFDETKPIAIYDRDEVAASNRAAANRRTDEKLVEEQTDNKLPETLEEATAAMIKQFEEEQKQEAARAELEAANLETEVQTQAEVQTQEAFAPEVETTFVITSVELDDLKNQMNASLEEIANLLIGQQNVLDGILERLNRFNTRSGQKI